MEELATLVQETPTILAPPGVWTPRLIEGLAELHEHPYRTQIVDLLRAAERDIFTPFLTLSLPASFSQQFEFLALKYAPIRIQTLLWFAHGVHLDAEFIAKYFEATRKAKTWFIDNSWGLSKTELATTFDQYLRVSLSLVNAAPKMADLAANDIVALIRPITEVDFGLTSLTFAFEKEIKPLEWVVAQTFSRTRGALLEYERAVESLNLQAEEAHEIEKELEGLRPDGGVEQPTDRDLRSKFRRYFVPR